MNCPNCTHPNNPGAKFCEECGTPLARKCEGCGHDLSATAKFCESCGTPVSDSGPAIERTPETYTPKHLADKILRSKSALEGERKQVTVMFADVKGSMDLAGQLDPEDWHKVLDRFFEILGEGVHRFEGTINQYTGDGIMALFGAPIAHEDHAQRACHAALLLRDLLSDFANEVRRTHGVDFSTRIGLNSGEVVVGKIGDDLRMDYTAQGLAVGLAQRMEALAETGKPCMTPYTANLVRGFFELEDLGEFSVKGVEDPLPVFALLEAGAARTRVERLDGAGLSTFMGRDLEMETLKAAYAESEAGRGQVIGIVGGPGLGKSRLFREFSRYVEKQGGFTLTVHNPSHGKDVPLSGFLAAMRSYFRIDPNDSPEESRNRIQQRFLKILPDDMELCSFMCDFLGVPDPDHPLPKMTPEQRQKHLEEFQIRNLKPRTEKIMTVMLMEDMHWSDVISESLFGNQVEWTPSMRQMVICSHRPEYTPPWASKSFYRQIPLQPLGEEAKKLLVDELLGSSLAGSELALRIQQRCDGNPFFIEETIQSLAESGVLSGERGAYTTTQAAGEMPFPSTVQAVLNARIDRLSPNEKHVLQTASIIGRNFLRPILQSVAGLTDESLNAAIETLKDSEFIFEESRYPDIEYSFKHALTQDAAYGSQLNENRQVMHAKVAARLEEHFENLQDEKSSLIAQHWEKSGNRNIAASWYARSATWTGLNDAGAALNHWRRVHKLAQSMDESDERDDFLIQACTEILSFGWRMGASDEEIDAVYAEGRSIAKRRNDVASEALVTGMYGIVRYSNSGSGEDYGRYGEEAALLARQCEEPGLRASLSSYAAFGHWAAGNVEKVLEWSQKTQEEVGQNRQTGKEFLGFSPGPSSLLTRIEGLANAGHLEEAWQLCDQTAEETQSLGETEIYTWISIFRAHLSRLSGEPRFNVSDGKEVVEIADEMGVLSSKMCGYYSLGIAHLMAGENEAAVETITEAIRIGEEHRTQRGLIPRFMAALANAELAMGNHKKAIDISREAAELGRLGGCKIFEAEAQITLARSMRVADPKRNRAEIETALDRAKELYRICGGRSLIPQMVEERAKLARALGEESESKNLFETALDQFSEVGANGHVKRLTKILQA